MTANVHTLRPFTPNKTVVIPGDLVSLARQYLSNAETFGLANNTINAYRSDLQQFVGFCNAMDVTLVQHVTGVLMDDFTAGLIRGNGVKPRTAARKLAAVKELMKFAVKRKLIKHNPEEDATRIRFISPKVIAPDEGPILEMINNIPADTVTGIRDRAVFYLMYCAGMRNGGLRSLQVFDAANPPEWTVTPGGVVRYKAKGGHTADTVADMTALTYINKWLEARKAWPKARNNPVLFVTYRGTALSNQMLSMQIKQHGRRVGIKHITPHMLRHRRIGEVADKCGLQTAQRMAGHKDINTTGSIYGNVSAERVRHRILKDVPVGASKEKEAC